MFFQAAIVIFLICSILSGISHSMIERIVAGYAESIQTVFIISVPIAALAFLATWFIPQVELKQWSSAATVPDSPASPEALDPEQVW